MTATLSFRKESIQRASTNSETTHRPVTEGVEAKHGRDRQIITLTTSLTIFL